MTAVQKIQERLAVLHYELETAKKSLASAAVQMSRRAAEAIVDTNALMSADDAPVSLAWVEFAEQDLRNAREAKAQLMALLQEKAKLNFFLK